MQPDRLTIPAYILIGFGVFSAATAVPALSAPLLVFLELAFLDFGGVNVDEGHRFLGGIVGGLTAGWGAMLLALAQKRPLRVAVLTGGFTWYLIDSSASALSGAPINALYNLAFLALFLWAARPEAKTSQPA